MELDNKAKSALLYKQCKRVGSIGLAFTWFGSLNDYVLSSIDKHGDSI